jgi:hypothetical protein
LVNPEINQRTSQEFRRRRFLKKKIPYEEERKSKSKGLGGSGMEGEEREI